MQVTVIWKALAEIPVFLQEPGAGSLLKLFPERVYTL
jgi:hypothetical protein